MCIGHCPLSQKPFGLESYSDEYESVEDYAKALNSHKSLSAWSPIRTQHRRCDPVASRTRSQKPFGLESYSDYRGILATGNGSQKSHKSLSAWSPIRT